ncbi:MAG: bifunctional diaminohydroxyphosphoribosylaminopyrimidine deaminase/5-amino-6-(5-phosphoribosylamino)uracil reductase RibD [Burkholderiales bacterium]|nr:bifunctional diaminohydroxyphosphoribosylaminopyrimidine deaminase/5-amino-6-(5-phosphoribosylamino)uracil reductase RibD [Burkholderiales bacterium]
MSFSDLSWMQRALNLAELAQPNCPPNPAVGCVIVKDRQVIGEGYTQETGKAHAEVMALRDAANRGNSVEGATVYVTLEPCSHYGRTPPCAKALIEAKPARVVAALQDPNPLVAGNGLKMLKDAGIQVECGICSKEAHEMNIGFFKRIQTGMPFVRTKMAMSLDGNIALKSGESKWITEEISRTDGQHWRARVGAILTGSGTVLADNPQLNVRLPGTKRQPLKVIVDSNLKLNPDSKIFQDGKVLLVCSRYDVVKVGNFEALGVEVLVLPGKDGKVDLKALMAELGKREINEVHVEAGPRLNGALVKDNLIDEFLIYVAPMFIGDGIRLLDLPQCKSLAEAPRMKIVSADLLNTDLRIRLRAAEEKPSADK